MKRTCFIFTLLLVLTGVCAQTTRKEVYADLDKAGGVYLAYQAPATAQSPAPEGYTPFYVSHYGRHGSRYLLGDRDYRWVMDLLKSADSINVLTPLGKSALTRLEKIWPIVEGHGGDLSPVGVRQHQGIAERMYNNYPGVFTPGRKVSARSTVSLRCAMSMAAFGDELKGLAPKLDISYEASEKYMDYLNYHTAESNAFTDQTTGPWVAEYKKFEAQNVRPERMMKALFTDSNFVKTHVKPADLMWGFYWIAVDMQDIDTDVRFYDVFEPAELFDLWQCVNYKFYVGNANHADGNGIVVANAKNLLRNILNSADEAIADGDIAATLRFGHDGNVIPLLAILRVENFNVAVSSPAEVYKVWCDFKATPMAANVQLVFYKNSKGNIIVKFLHNEREVHIPVKTDMFPYYNWNDVKAFYQTILNS